MINTGSRKDIRVRRAEEDIITEENNIESNNNTDKININDEKNDSNLFNNSIINPSKTSIHHNLLSKFLIFTI